MPCTRHCVPLCYDRAHTFYRGDYQLFQSEIDLGACIAKNEKSTTNKYYVIYVQTSKTVKFLNGLVTLKPESARYLVKVQSWSLAMGYNILVPSVCLSVCMSVCLYVCPSVVPS